LDKKLWVRIGGRIFLTLMRNRKEILFPMKKLTHFTVLFLLFGVPSSTFSAEDAVLLTLLPPSKRYLHLMEQADLLAEAGDQASA
jgi:hypothetical protein